MGTGPIEYAVRDNRLCTRLHRSRRVNGTLCLAVGVLLRHPSQFAEHALIPGLVPIILSLLFLLHELQFSNDFSARKEVTACICATHQSSYLFFGSISKAFFKLRVASSQSSKALNALPFRNKAFTLAGSISNALSHCLMASLYLRCLI